MTIFLHTVYISACLALLACCIYTNFIRNISDESLNVALEKSKNKYSHKEYLSKVAYDHVTLRYINRVKRNIARRALQGNKTYVDRFFFYNHYLSDINFEEIKKYFKNFNIQCEFQTTFHGFEDPCGEPRIEYEW